MTHRCPQTRFCVCPLSFSLSPPVLDVGAPALLCSPLQPSALGMCELCRYKAKGGFCYGTLAMTLSSSGSRPHQSVPRSYDDMHLRMRCDG